MKEDVEDYIPQLAAKVTRMMMGVDDIPAQVIMTDCALAGSSKHFLLMLDGWIPTGVYDTVVLPSPDSAEGAIEPRQIVHLARVEKGQDVYDAATALLRTFGIDLDADLENLGNGNEHHATD